MSYWTSEKGKAELERRHARAEARKQAEKLRRHSLQTFWAWIQVLMPWADGQPFELEPQIY